MPTFIVFQRGRPVNTVRGADPQKLSEAVRKLASEATKSDETPGEPASSGETTSGVGWVGAAVPKIGRAHV